MKAHKAIGRYRTTKVLLVIGAIFLLLQVIRPSLDNPAVGADFRGPEDISAIFKRACYDCHSNQSRLSWFDYIQPAYYRVVSDIKAARAGLNFSEWGLMGADEQKGKLFEILNQIELGSMPPGDYLLLHRGAKVSHSEFRLIKNYVSGLLKSEPASPELISDAEKQFKNWVPGLAVRSLPKTVTGVPYFANYENWKVINITDRLDNNSLRIIFGNEVAARAVREKKTNPWPKGTVLAKVMWDRLADAEGAISTGSFKQVEFMIKDEKYASTAGWGWARFKTMALLPYGKNAGYATECVNCHTPVKGSDYVFTKPLNF